MNLIHGKIVCDREAEVVLDGLYDELAELRGKNKIDVMQVISACDSLSRELGDEHLPVLLALGMNKSKAKEELAHVKLMLSKEYLNTRLERELLCIPTGEFTPYGESRKVRHEIFPLGVLLHIAAGNVDALPVFSVLEGLLTGNINILKLPGGENGLSVMILEKLIERYPMIAEYVYVYDTPSTDLSAIEKMAKVSDAVVVWGGDTAISAARNMLPPDIKIIEWGHKLSFAYAETDAEDAELYGIAYNICDTDGLLCSSCQGIYVDTDDFDLVCGFAERFLSILERCCEDIGKTREKSVQAQKTIELYTEELESTGGDKSVLKGKDCAVIAYKDSGLMPSYMFGCCWVKPLPKDRIVYELSKYKNRLQTVAIAGRNKGELENIFAKTPIVRMTSGENMSRSYCGAAHDGEFSLMRYVRIVSYEY